MNGPNEQMARSRARLLVQFGIAIGVEQSGASGENAETAIASYRQQIDVVIECMRHDASRLDKLDGLVSS